MNKKWKVPSTTDMPTMAILKIPNIKSGGVITKFKIIVFSFLYLVFSFLSCLPAYEIDYSKLMADKMRLEQEMESKTQEILDRILGPEKSNVMINLDFSYSKEETVQTSLSGENKESRKPYLSAPETEKGFFLPGIPLKSPDVPQAPKELPTTQKEQQEATKSKTVVDPSLIKKISVTIVIDQSVKQRTADTIRSAVTKALALNMERGDELFIEKAPFTTPGSVWDFLKKPLTWIIFAILTIFSLLFYFLIGPLRYMLSNFLETWKAVKTGVSPEDLKKKKEQEEAAELEQKALEEALEKQPQQIASGGGGGGVAAMGRGGLPSDIFDLEEGEKPEEEEEKKEEEKKEGDEEMAEEKKEEGMLEEKPAETEGAVPGAVVPEEEVKEEVVEEERIPSFDFIRDEQIKRLGYLLQIKGADFTVAVLNFLKPEIATKVVLSFPPSFLVKVSKSIMQVKQITREQLKQLRDEIENKIDFVVGGVDYLVEILNQAPKGLRERILSSIKEENQAMGERIAGLIFTFENVVTVPNISIQTLLQQDIKMDVLATALRGVSDEVRNKFTSNMTEAMMTLLKEEMEFGKPVTTRMIEESQKTIIDTMRRLEREGKIVMVEGELAGAYDDVSEYGEIVLGKELEEMARLEKEKQGDSFEKGVKLYSEGNYEAAVQEFNNALAQGKESAELCQYLGSSLYSLGREEEAFASFDKSLELNPGNDDLRTWLNSIPAYTTRARV